MTRRVQLRARVGFSPASPSTLMDGYILLDESSDRLVCKPTNVPTPRNGEREPTEPVSVFVRRAR